MPVVLRQNGYRFFFYSREGDPREPPHVHVEKGDADAKVWLRPFPHLADTFGFSKSELAAILRIVAEHRATMEAGWHDHFADQG